MASKAAESEGVVCYCICNFPLPGLRARDLKDHPTNTFLMHHFHLPPHAQQAITALNMMEWVQWFGRLHHAYRTLKAAAEIQTFEQSVDTAFQQVQQTFSGVRQGLQSLREAFTCELEKAIAETSMHAIDQWEPEANSLSWLIWHCDVRNPDSLKVFDLGVECTPFLRLSVKSRVPSLSHCNLQVGAAQDELEALRAENATLRGKLQEAVDTINSRTAQVTVGQFEQKSLHENLDLKTESCSEDLCKAVQTDNSADWQRTKFMRTHVAKEKKSKVKSIDAQVDLSITTHGIKNKVHQLPTVAKALKTHGKEGKNNQAGFGGEIEALGAHLGKFKDAHDIIAKMLEEQRGLDPTDVKVLETLNVQAALYFHCGQEKECIEVCKKVLQNCNHCHSQLYLTALYFYSYVVSDEDIDTVVEEDIRNWVSMMPKSDNSLCEALEMCVIGRIESNQKRYGLALIQLERAQDILNEFYHISLFAAMNTFCLGRVYTFLNKDITECHTSAEEVFSAAFSKSIWRAVNFYWMGEAYTHFGSFKKVFTSKKKANEIFMDCHRSNIYFPDNLSEIADLYERKRTSILDEIEYREKAQSAYSEFHPRTIKAMQNLTRLGTLYRRQKRLEDAKRCLHEAREILATHHPSSIEAGQNSLCLALMYEELGQSVEALQFATEAKKVLSTTSEVAREDLRAAEKLLSRLLVTKKRKLEEKSTSF